MSFERANIERMTGYGYGEQPADAKVIKLNTNENPYPPSPDVARALAAVDVASLRQWASGGLPLGALGCNRTRSWPPTAATRLCGWR